MPLLLRHGAVHQLGRVTSSIAQGCPLSGVLFVSKMSPISHHTDSTLMGGPACCDSAQTTSLSSLRSVRLLAPLAPVQRCAACASDFLQTRKSRRGSSDLIDRSRLVSDVLIPVVSRKKATSGPFARCDGALSDRPRDHQGHRPSKGPPSRQLQTPRRHPPQLADMSPARASFVAGSRKAGVVWRCSKAGALARLAHRRIVELYKSLKDVRLAERSAVFKQVRAVDVAWRESAAPEWRLSASARRLNSARAALDRRPIGGCAAPEQLPRVLGGVDLLGMSSLAIKGRRGGQVVVAQLGKHRGCLRSRRRGRRSFVAELCRHVEPPSVIGFGLPHAFGPPSAKALECRRWRLCNGHPRPGGPVS